MSAASTNNVHSYGDPSGQPVLFAHGFGCDQGMWRAMAPYFESDYRVLLFDHVGMGGSDLAAYDPDDYATLDGYATDVVAICEDLDLRDVILVGHSVSSMIGALAVRKAPERFARMVMVCPSPRYIDDPATGYVGGFSAADIEDLLDTLSANYLGWSATMAPVIVGNPDRPQLGEDLTERFCQVDPVIAAQFARATFLSDNRADLPHVQVPTLVLQTRDDAIAPEAVGEYVAAHLPDATLSTLDAVGHCPNLAAPEETATAILDWL